MEATKRALGGSSRRNYPPLAIAATCALALLAILPSSLNLPQSNPAETLEYAPVPPEDGDTPPAAGNISSLGLGSSGSATSDSAAGSLDQDAGGGSGGRVIKAPSTKRCVGNPPRQTEDPLSPPCVASWTGDNGGATYQGVTAAEVRILFAFGGGDPCGLCSANSPETAPRNRYYDLGEPPPANPYDEFVQIRALRVWQRYFNDRYQTYGRFVRFFVHYGPGNNTTESARAQAAENYQKLQPFSATAIGNGAPNAYTEIMARKGVVAFTDIDLAPGENFSKFAGQLWNYAPSLEVKAEIFTSHICSKVVAQPVSDSGNPGENGQPRRLGLLHSADEEDPAYVRFWKLVKSDVERCGGTFVAEGAYPYDAYIGGDPSVAGQVIADFRDKGVTTIIWPGGQETNFSRAAKAVAYFPEWIVASMGLTYGALNGQGEDQEVWDHAWMLTEKPLVEPGGITPTCAAAYNEAGGIDHPLERNYSCSFSYDIVRQAFTGIQVAGPSLNVRNLDKGFHAIPAKNSPQPDVPACYYGPGDYTCVKDHTVMWWDSTAQGSWGKGCYRMAEGGARYTPGTWPDGNLDAQRKLDDICNHHGGGF